MGLLDASGTTLASVCAFAISALLTALSIGYARKRQLLDAPGRRRSHAAPTPRGGGIGAVVAIVLCAAIPAALSAAGGARFAAAAVALLLVAAIGWIDDHRSLGIRVRITVHALAAVLLLAASAPSLTVNGIDAAIVLALAFMTVAAFAVVWSINLHNFMDGINGLLTLQVLFVLGASVLLMQVDGEGALVEQRVVLISAFAVLAFLPFNFPRARIFMGDVGSGALGLLVAMAVLWQMQRTSLAPATGIVLCSAFVTDATATLLMRMLRGRRWYSAHREHLYQWLVRSGRSHAQVVMFYMGWNVLVALPVAWAMNYADWSRNHAAAFGSSESGVWISILGDALPWILAVYGVALVLWIAGRRHCIRSVRRRVGAVHAQ